MDKLLDNVKKELKQIEDEGLNSNNLDHAAKLTQMYHHLSEEEREGEDKLMRHTDYGRGGSGRVDYNYQNDRPYYDDYPYGRRGGYSRRGGYRGNDSFRDHLDRIMEGADMYEYGRNRYMEGGSEERIYDGLEKLMYAVCTFVESTMDFAETPEEKEIIRKHIQKMKNL